MLRDETVKAWLLSHYDDIRTTVNDGTFVRHPSKAEEGSITRMLADPDDPEGGRTSILFMDDPDHARNRRPLMQAFYQRIKKMEAEIVALIDGVIDAAPASGRFDLMEHIAVPIPILVIAHILGVDESRLGEFRAWSEGLILGLNPMRTPEQTAYMEASRDKLDRYFTELMEARRNHPRSDLISDMVQAQAAGGDFADEELRINLQALLVGGNLTTTDLIGNGVWLFLTSVYFIISKKDNIKFIPVSLSIFALLTVLGPFSAFNVSERSQTNRLETLLSQNNMLVDGKAVPAKDSLPGADAESIRSTLHYLREYEHFRTAAGWFGLPDDKTPDWSELDKLINDLNIGYAMASARDCFASFPDYNGIDLDDYEKMYIVYTNDGESPGDSLTGFSLTKDRKALLLWENGQATDQFDLQPYLQKIAGKYDCGKDQFNKEDALFNTGGSIWDAKLVTQNMSFEKGENYSVKQWNGIILLRRKQ